MEIEHQKVLLSLRDKVVNPNGRSNGEFGTRGMQLSDTNYAIHGTNEPDSIGLDESLGCVRMNTADVEELFALAPQGTPGTDWNESAARDHPCSGSEGSLPAHACAQAK